MRRAIVPSAAVMLAAVAFGSLPVRPVVAATAPAFALDRLAEAWMGTLALLADDADEDRDDDEDDDEDEDRDDERCECDGKGCERCQGGRRHAEGGHGDHRRGRHAGPGPRPGMGGPHPVLMKMDDIVARLARIESKLDGRAGGPPRGAWRGPGMPEGGPGPRPEMSPEAREQWSQRMEGARREMRSRMEEGRERMEQARRMFREMEERIKKLEAEVERLKADR